MPSPERSYLSTHRAHDVHATMRRWKALAKEAGLVPVRIGKQGEYVVTGFRPRVKYPDSAPWIYLSAGVHGDEPAAVLGLLEWAEEHAEMISRHPFLIIPVFSPWGIANNRRNDDDDIDPNRNFNNPGYGFMADWRQFIGGRRIRLSLTLHEDFEATGSYVYELSNRDEYRAEVYLAASEAAIPHEPGASIDGMAAKNGVIRRKRAPDMPGLPEALVLHLAGADVTMTFETPSEFSLYHRAKAQRLFIGSAVRYALKNP